MATCGPPPPPPPPPPGAAAEAAGASDSRNDDDEAASLMVSARFQRLDATDRDEHIIDIPDDSAGSSYRGLFTSYNPKDRRVKVTIPEDSACAAAFQFVWNGSQFSGVVCMALSSLAYGFMSTLVRLLGGHSIPMLELISIRCAIIAAISLGVLKWEGTPLLGSPSTRPLVLGRAAAGFFAMACFTISIGMLPLPDATLLSFASPILASLVARVSLKEKIKAQELGGALASALGLIFLLEPPMIFGGVAVPDGMKYLLAIIVGLFASLVGSVSHCLTRAIGKTGESPFVVVFTFAAISSAAAALCTLLFESFVLPSPRDFIGIVFVSLIGFLAQLLLVRSLQLGKVSRATPVQYIQPVALLALEAVFLGRTPSPTNLAGAAVVILGVGCSVVWGSFD